MNERSDREASVADQRRCPACGSTKQASDFYAGCSECKTCKRDRSRNNRALAARKIAAFERFVDALIILADKTGDSPADRGNARADAAMSTTAAA